MLEIYVENILEKGKKFSSGEISPLFHNNLLPDVRFLTLNKDQIFSSRPTVIRDNRSRDIESRLYVEININESFKWCCLKASDYFNHQ